MVQFLYYELISCELKRLVKQPMWESCGNTDLSSRQSVLLM